MVVVWLLAGVAQARPGNTERYPVGAEATGRGGAAIASGGSAWHNPAGMGLAAKEGISASVSAYGYTFEEVPAFMDVGVEGGRITGSLENAAVDLFPASLDYVKPLGSLGSLRHGAGLSIVVPDFDQFDGALEVPAEELLLEVRARRLSESETFWIVPAWGACAARFCFGLAPTIAVHLAEEVSITTFFSEFEDGTTFDGSESVQSKLLIASIGGQVGALVELAGDLWLGLTVRTPVTSVLGTGEVLNVSTVVDGTGVGPSYVDRVEVEKAKTAYRLPWRFGLGLAYGSKGSFRLAADARLSLGQSEYALMAGPNGEDALPPAFPGGVVEDPGRALGVSRRIGLRPTVNFNAGAELPLTEAMALLVGAFSDLSATSEQDALENGNDQLSRLGATLGVALRGEELTTWISAVYAYGWGKALGISDGFEDVLTDERAHSVLLMLGSTAEL